MADVLVAEDENEIVEFVRIILSSSGYSLRAVSSGMVVLEEMKRQKPDLLILDLMLPGFDGHTVLMKMSEDPMLRTIPVVVMTALDYTSELFTKFPQVKAFLVKPFHPEQLEKIVKEGLSSVSKAQS